MSQADHISDIAFSTAFLTDKTCGLLSGSFPGADTTLLAPGDFMYQYIIPHSFTRPVQCDTWISTDGGESFDGLGAITYSDSSNLYVNVLDNTKDYVYKVVCTWIDDYDATNPLVPIMLSGGAGASFDTRFNYQKILVNDVISMTSSSGLTHVPYLGDGSLHNYNVYFESLPGQVWPIINGGAEDQWLNDPVHQWEVDLALSASEIELIASGGSSAADSFRVWYKIYHES